MEEQIVNFGFQYAKWLNNEQSVYPPGNCKFKVNNKNTNIRCEICSKLTIKTPERCHWSHSGVFIVNFEHISNLQVNGGWVLLICL